MSNDEISGILYLVIVLIIVVWVIVDMKLSTTKVKGDDINEAVMIAVMWPVILIFLCVAAPIDYFGTKLKKWINKGKE